MKKSIVVGAVVAALVAANVATLLALHKSDAHEHGPWASMETVKVPDRPDLSPVFPDDLRAHDGKRVTLTGVAFVMNAGVEGDSARWCVLMPPSRYGCCGISCNPKPELSVFVDCAGRPLPTAGRKQFMASVEGTFRLRRSADSWCLYSLEDAVVSPVEP